MHVRSARGRNGSGVRGPQQGAGRRLEGRRGAVFVLLYGGARTRSFATKERTWCTSPDREPRGICHAQSESYGLRMPIFNCDSCDSPKIEVTARTLWAMYEGRNGSISRPEHAGMYGPLPFQSPTTATAQKVRRGMIACCGFAAPP